MDWTKKDIERFSISKNPFFKSASFLYETDEVDKILHPEKVEKNRLSKAQFSGSITLKKGNLTQELEFARDSIDELMGEMIKYLDEL